MRDSARGTFTTQAALLALPLILLIFGQVSPAYAAFEASGASPNSITLTWTAPGDDDRTGTASEYDIRYSLATITAANWDAASQVTGEPSPQLAGSSEQFTVTGLESNTIYYFAIKVADEIPNWSGISNVAVRSTDAEIDPPAAVADLTSGNATPNSLDLSWTATGDDGNTGTATQCDIRYATSPITDANWDAAIQVTGEQSPQTAGSSESFSVTGLSPATTYYFALKVADEVPNWSPLSNVTSAATSNEETPPSMIANLGAGNPTEHSIELNWSAPGDDGAAGTATEYDIRYSTAFISGATWASAMQVANEPSPQPAGSFEVFIVSGLESGTEYYFAIKTVDDVGNWSAISNSPNTSSSPDATAPESPADMIAVMPTLTSLTLVWSAPGDDGATGTASEYDIRYDTIPITDANWGSALQVNNEPAPQAAGTPESLTVNGLIEGTTYYFALKCADEVPNWSGLSNVATGNTELDITPPATIDDLAATAGSSPGEINLSWSAPGEDGDFGSVLAYQIRYGQSPISEMTWDAASIFTDAPTPDQPGRPQSVTIASLNPGEMYYIAMKSIDDAANVSAISNIASAIAHFQLSVDIGDAAQPAFPPYNAVLPTSQPVLTARYGESAQGALIIFELATDSNFVGLVSAGPADSDSADVASWKVPVSLETDQTYYWRVRTEFAGYSHVTNFSVQPFTHAYPNPVKFSQAAEATFTDLPTGDNLLITSVSGSIVREWADLSGDDIQWDGTNAAGNRVASGTYMWYLPDTGAKGKLIVIK